MSETVTASSSAGCVVALRRKCLDCDEQAMDWDPRCPLCCIGKISEDALAAMPWWRRKVALWRLRRRVRGR